ncbi:MAG: hypothetical protein WCJ59_01660 [bacterium]
MNEQNPNVPGQNIPNPNQGTTQNPQPNYNYQPPQNPQGQSNYGYQQPNQYYQPQQINSDPQVNKIGKLLIGGVIGSFLLPVIIFGLVIGSIILFAMFAR